MKIKTKHPVQPVIQDEHGCHRFRSNAIVNFLMDVYRSTGKDLNTLVGEGFNHEDWEQFSQLTGYSVCGFADLSHASNRAIRIANKRSIQLSDALARLGGKLPDSSEDDD